MRSRSATDDETRVAAACARVGLHPAWRRATFSVTWAALEEWVHTRWLTVADEARRARAERWLAQVRSRTSGLLFSISETLLVARKG